MRAIGPSRVRGPHAVFISMIHGEIDATSNPPGFASGAHARQRHDPHRSARERYANVPAAAFRRASRERAHHAERAEIAGGVVVDRGGNQRWMLIAGVLVRHAGNGLRELFPSGPTGKRTLVSIAVNRDHDDTGPHLRHFLRRETAPRERTGTISLREHVRIADQRAQAVDVRLAIEIEVARTLAGVGVDDERLDRRQLGTSHVQHLGAVLRQSARAGRSREHAREIQNAHA